MSSSPSTSNATPEIRELAARESHGLQVVLRWHPREDAVSVSIEDSRTGDRLQLVVPRERALEAFYHPFAYAPRAAAVAALTRAAAQASQSRRG